ncbi:ABC transporter substrate-binding protein [Pseudactinotalea sp. HY158]|uniref:ABC transporter substrate-binding protein n=1 Tax=Pseudactinotalea sp. HY158 TaxID=2654547 RepID=UPI00129D019E|nr:ABC transporter substrate-binding protein [Pseudactinotalea sp. HY158]QGH68380.1 ABC transporter substrate-binding protein [Pseudactinotalea sp. HY158]
MKIQPTFDRRNFLRATGLFAAAGIVTAVAACAPQDGTAGGSTGDSTDTGADQASGAANTDGTINAGISYELGSNGYDPMTTSAALTIAANWHTLEGLTELDPATLETYNALAAADPTKVDDTTWTVTLRDGATFHDGTPVTPEDVVYSFERVLDPENASLYSQFIPFIDSVEATDDTTVTFTLAYPAGVFTERLSVVKIVPKAAVEADRDAFDAQPIGSGPYKLVDNGAGGTVKFERFEEYNGPRPALAATMNWQVLADATARVNALTSQTVQAIDSVPYLDTETLAGQGATVDSVQGFGLLFIMFNMGSEIWSDLRNRQAVMYGIDLAKLVDNGLLGNGEAATSFLQSTHPNYNEAKVVYDHDPEKAKALLAESGLAGKSITITCTDHDWVKKCTPLIKEDLDALGLDVTLDEGQSAGVYTKIDSGPDAYEILVAPGDPSVFGNDPDLLMRWWLAGDVWTDQRMHWKGQDSYEQMQTLLDEGLRAQDPAAQQQAWDQAFDLLSEEVPLYPLFHRSVPTAWDGETLVDFKPISLTGLSFENVASTQ